MKKLKEQNIQIAVVENTKLTELAQKSGIELTKAEAHVSAFHPALAELSELSRPLATLDKERAGDAMVARENRLKIVKIRTGSESIKDERKKVLLAESNLIQSAFNLVKDVCILTESEYEEIEKHQERIEAQKRAELKESRIALLLPFETDTTYLLLDIMSEDQFNALFAKEKEAFEAVTAKRLKDELDRIEAERVAEEKRLAEIEAEKQRQIERDAELAEIKRMQNLRIEAYNKYKLLAEPELIKLGFTKDDNGVTHTIVQHFIGSNHYSFFQTGEELEGWINEVRLSVSNALEEKRIKDEAIKAAADKEAELAELKAKQAAIELAKESERLAKIAEQEEKDAKAKAALLAPDKEKINALYISIRDFAFPECQTPEANQIIKDVQEGMKIILDGIKTKSSNLK